MSSMQGLLQGTYKKSNTDAFLFNNLPRKGRKPFFMFLAVALLCEFLASYSFIAFAQTTCIWAYINEMYTLSKRLCRICIHG